MAQLNTQILLRSDSTANWAREILVEGSETEYQPIGAHAVLGKGEIGVEFLSDGTQKVKIGDGTTIWKNLKYFGGEAANVHQVSSVSALPEDANIGDTGIVKVQIADTGKYTYTGYVFTESGWAAMDGNYDASNVYFDSDITFTANIGALTLGSGKTSDTLTAKGKSLEEVLKSILAKTVAPTITPASYSLASNGVVTDTGTNEIGSKIKTIKWNGTFNPGNYSFGSKDDEGVFHPADDGKSNTTTDGTGVTATYKVTNSIDSQESTAIDGSFDLAAANYIEIDDTKSKTYAKVSGKATWGASTRHPVNNIGEIVDGTIAAGEQEVKDVAITATGYRSTFVYIGTDCTTTVDSAFLRGATGANKGNIGATIGTLTIPAGTKRVVIAIPGTHNWHATNKGCEDTAGMNLDIKDKFTRTTGVGIEGANGFTAADYTVFEFVNTNGVSATTFKISIT